MESVVARLQEQACEARTTASVLGATEDLEPGEAQRLMTHPLPHWVERMTVSYLKAHGGKAERKSRSWNLTWPDGETYENVVFTGKEAERLPAARHLTLEEPKVRGLAMRLPRFAPGQPVPVVSIPGISGEIQGFWSLWRIAIATHGVESSQDHASFPGRQRHGLHADGQARLGPASCGKHANPFCARYLRFRKKPSRSCRAPRRNTEGPSTNRWCRSTGLALLANAKKPTMPLPRAAGLSSGSVCPKSATIA